MGKRIIARARGKGGPRYRAPSHRYLGRVEYFPFPSFLTAKILDILHDPGRSAPVMIVRSNGKEVLHIAPQGIKAGDTISYGKEIKIGNVVELGKIPEGTKIFGIEARPGSGPKFCRSSGSFAEVFSKIGNKVAVRLSSGRIIELDEKCRATIGIPAASGRVEKYFVKAGKKFYAMQARGKLWPRTKGVVMSPVDHPYGGKSHRPKPSKTVSRHAPPGAKVGSIAARRLGRKKGR